MSAKNIAVRKWKIIGNLTWVQKLNDKKETVKVDVCVSDFCALQKINISRKLLLFALHN